MLFSDFSFSINSGINKVFFNVDISYDFFKAKTTLESEKMDFDHFLLELSELYNMKIKTCCFSPFIERTFNMKFELLEYGHIKILVELYNQLYNAKLVFEYEIDQSFLPELMREIDITVNKE
jgi:hypothetical protein